MKHRIDAAVPSGTVSLYWNARSKRWDIVAKVVGPGNHESASISADSTVALDHGTLWLIVSAIRDELERELHF